MASVDVVQQSTKQKKSLHSVGKFDCEARCCCGFGDVIWVGELKGGIAVYSAQEGTLLERINVGNTDTRVHFKCIVAVFGEIWAGTITGEVHIFDGVLKRWKGVIRIHGVEAAAPITSLFFDGYSVLGGSETGRIVQWNPINKQQMTVFVALAPVTAVTVASGIVVSGDRNGAVQLWNMCNGLLAAEHTKDTSGVTSLLYEWTTSTLWVGRRCGSISVYALSPLLQFTGRVRVDGGAVISMHAVSGKVLVVSAGRTVAVVAAKTLAVLSSVAAAHDAFIHDAACVYAATSVRAWTIGNDGTARVWDVAGYYIPTAPTTMATTAANTIAANVGTDRMLQEAEWAVRISESQDQAASAAVELRAAREEVHELRVRHTAVDRTLGDKDAEIAAHLARVKELEEDVKRLQKTVADTEARADAAQRESTMLRKDYNTALQDASQARAQVSAKIAEKSGVEQQLSEQRTEKSHLEIRLRDKEAEVTQLKAENAKLQNILSGKSLSSSILPSEKDMYQKMLANNSGAMHQEMDELRKKCQLMSGLLVSMEYTIRRKEEEERDLTALMNAFRRKVADRVTDPHLAALLNLTMLRNPSRFEMECDEHTKLLLRDRNGPFIRFLQLLRDREPRTYEELVEYLQHPLAGSKFGDIFEKLMFLAQKEGGISDSDMVSFKKSLPTLLDSLNALNASKTITGGGGSSAIGGQQGSTLTGSAATSQHPLTSLDANRNSTMGGDTFNKNNTNLLSATGYPGGTLQSATTLQQQQQQQQQPVTLGAAPSGTAVPPQGVDDLTVFLRSLNPFRENLDSIAQGPLGSAEDSYVKQLRSTFEFILQTRRDLVEQLSVLVKRVVKARQVVDALTSNARDNSSPSHLRLSVSGGGISGSGGSSAVGGRHSLGSIATNILEELHRLALGIVSTYLTTAEKQRVGFGV
ncbi:uncharacterized protein TM35_000272250 [Trypanosoma theileri]|uniref:Guanine nucleotide-binding protein subunit beta-like protein n=1 Tax=Trypanosoma theileri TaxID=67003 RepID=A0A1X0NPL3_9TRYP|nr:uncharacterized protein TM35_000272250 [Trypanosoma theileri]ORC86635.1 hypothetical protein TM35_000272250 [Trypanosoma theileri]